MHVRMLLQQSVVNGVLEADPAVSRALPVLPREILERDLVNAAEPLDARALQRVKKGGRTGRTIAYRARVGSVTGPV